VWGAQAVFIDEISRARPDIQNRLFPVIHERKVQGIALDGLEHRWAAMNPPPDRNSDDDLAHYAGSQELDLALADRFALHVVMPQWRAFEESEQERVILSALREPDTAIGQDLQRLLEQIRLRVPVVQAQWSGAIARYVRLLCRLLDEAGHVLSARRAVMIARNIVAVHAVRQAQAGSVTIDDSVWLAVLSSIPLAASGIRLPDSMLLASHREAWRLAAVAPEDPLALILGERDPVRRVQLALACDALPEGELTSIVTDALTQLPEGARHALAEWLFETHGIDRLSVVAVDDIAKAYSEVACLQEVSESVRPNSKAHKLWQALHQRLARLAPDEPLTERKANLLVSLFANRRLQVEADIDRILEAFTTTRESLAAAGQAA
jgi:MoxR-like ATPase